MARRRRKRQRGLGALIEMPWPVGVVLGVIGFLVIQYGIGRIGLMTGNPYVVPMAESFREGAFAPLAWLWLGLCWFASVLSFLKHNRKSSKGRVRSARREPSIDWAPPQTEQGAGQETRDPECSVDTSVAADAAEPTVHDDVPAAVTAENIANLSWWQFECLIAASFRYRGFNAELTTDGADGGVDIVLRERDNMLVVQCKHWHSSQVGVNIARELFGVMHAQGARKAILATSGTLTAEAKQFCHDNAIYWLDADRLLTFIDPAAMPPLHDIATDRASRCPLCGDRMVRRAGRESGRPFWGCVRFPACRGKRFAKAAQG